MIEVICVGVIGSSVIAIGVLEDKLIRKGLFVESDTLRGIVTYILAFSGIATSAWFIWQMVKKFV
ncbi:hypothetical protein [Metabacillus halosaccharovorans]|uniref:hypothetical protein n=1 Tax=Metabacillus halosaccharovorans TaxID=930124 RepID=UPI002041252E|nr:hypothetical protein [Metabacillus halosaccharovorans]MCM3444398.1 hypothetical protein [Metabacillus halosaccharovorans]